MRTTWTFHSAGSIVFGTGAVKQLGEIAQRHRFRKVLVVTDRNLVKAGVLEQVQQPLAAGGIAVEVFDGGEPEPSLAAADLSAQKARACRPDAVLGLGGGSNMDLAKITAVLLSHGGRPSDYVGEEKVPGPSTPVICVPTTSGTASEVTAAAVLTDHENQVKVGLLSNFMRPLVAVVDPLLTVSCPPKVTADSGIDALTHAIEAYTAVDNETFPLPEGERSVYQGRHPLGNVLAEQAIELVGKHLVRAVREPNNIEARTGMSLAALLAGLAFSNVGVALVHALEYPVGGATHCSHGCGNGLLLPYVMRYNRSVREKEFARIAELLGRNVSGMDPRTASEEAIVAVEELKRAIGIPRTLRELGVREEQLRPFAEKTAGIKRILRVNPRYPSMDDMVEILKSAW
jgi:alcohol dehydrogenase